METMETFKIMSNEKNTKQHAQNTLIMQDDV